MKNCRKNCSGVRRQSAHDQISAASSTGLRSRRRVRRSGTTIGQFKGATNPRNLASLKKPPKKLQRCPASVRARSNQRGKQYRTEKQQGQRTDLTSGNESQKPCPKLQTADRIASVSGVSPRTIKNADILTDNLSVRTDSYAADAALPNPAFFSRYVVSAP